MGVLLAAFQEAVNEKMKCQAEADATNQTIDLANRLVNGLASEKIRFVQKNGLHCGSSVPFSSTMGKRVTRRMFFFCQIYLQCSSLLSWSATVVNLKESGKMLPGDVLLVTAFISYVGCFTRKYRLQLINDDWIPNMAKTNVRYPIR